MTDLKYNLTTVLAQPVGKATDTTVEVEGAPLLVTASNLGEWVSLSIQGSRLVIEQCARCGKEFETTLPLDGTYRVQAEPTEDDVFALDRHGNAPLGAIIEEETELRRPIVAYCPDCEDAEVAPITIE